MGGEMYPHNWNVVRARSETEVGLVVCGAGPRPPTGWLAWGACGAKPRDHPSRACSDDPPPARPSARATLRPARPSAPRDSWQLVRWTVASSNLLRDWLLLQFQRGLATDDQGTLFAAQQRQRASGGLRVGQVPTPYAAAFYSPVRPHFYPRLTRPLTSGAVVIHLGSGNAGAYQAWCDAFNGAVGTRRQLWIPSKSNGTVQTLRGVRECRDALQLRTCPLVGAGSGPRRGANATEHEVFAPPLMDPKKLKVEWKVL